MSMELHSDQPPEGAISKTAEPVPCPDASSQAFSLMVAAAQSILSAGLALIPTRRRPTRRS